MEGDSGEEDGGRCSRVREGGEEMSRAVEGHEAADGSSEREE